MTTSVTFTTRFADYSTRTVTVPNVNPSGSALSNLPVLAKYFDYEPLKGIYVGKDGTAEPTELESVKIIAVDDVVVWTHEGGLVQ